LVRFSLDRRWATLAVAVLLGAGGGSLLGFVTAPGGGAQGLAPVEQPATSTTHRPLGQFAGVTSSTRPRRLPAATAGLRPATTATTSTARPTTTTAPASSTTRTVPTTTTTTTTIGDGTTTSSSTTVAPSTTSTTRAT
jgi:hypothetical protein